jgi:hypothetical protein
MKARLLLTVVALLLIGDLSTEVLAQENINAVIKKSEGLSSVKETVTRINNKGKRSEIKTIVITDNKALADEFAAAFKKDSDAADNSVENETNGTLTTLMCKFGDITYTYSVNKGPRLDFSEEWSIDGNTIKNNKEKKDVEVVSITVIK